jgi:putative transposase
MKRFRSAGLAQRFLSVHDQVANVFRHSAKSNAGVNGNQTLDIWSENGK